MTEQQMIDIMRSEHERNPEKILGMYIEGASMEDYIIKAEFYEDHIICEFTDSTEIEDQDGYWSIDEDATYTKKLSLDDIKFIFKFYN